MRLFVISICLYWVIGKIRSIFNSRSILFSTFNLFCVSYIPDEISGRITYYTQAYTFAEHCLNTVITSNWTANTSIKDKKLVLIEKKYVVCQQQQEKKKKKERFIKKNKRISRRIKRSRNYSINPSMKLVEVTHIVSFVFHNDPILSNFINIDIG